MERIIREVCSSLEELPPEVSAGVIKFGMVLTGGASKLSGLTDRISRQTGVVARRASSDVQSVAVLGAGKLFRDGQYPSIREMIVQIREQKLRGERKSEDLTVDQEA